jgi:hypothetical protein
MEHKDLLDVIQDLACLPILPKRNEKSELMVMDQKRTLSVDPFLSYKTSKRVARLER